MSQSFDLTLQFLTVCFFKKKYLKYSYHLSPMGFPLKIIEDLHADCSGFHFLNPGQDLWRPRVVTRGTTEGILEAGCNNQRATQNSFFFIIDFY